MPPAGTLIVLLGPTGVGKTALGIRLARALGTSIVSCDSRQLYREMNVGTAAPTPRQLAAAPHFLVRAIPAEQPYNCWKFEQQALEYIRALNADRGVALAVGGSMLYIDALCRGIDNIPDVDPAARAAVALFHQREGIEPTRQWLRALDPEYYLQVDLKNPKRVMHAIEICLTAGVPYSSLRSGNRVPREFAIVKIGLTLPPPELRRRVDLRVDAMLAAGLEQEARDLYPLRHLNALDTVGYKEWFAHFDGRVTREEAIRLIRRDTWRYARKQLTWFRRDAEITWFSPRDADNVIAFALERAGMPDRDVPPDDVPDDTRDD
ncbi:MAG: tRNA (adenosine(37)-N6)-dimethylallyltransferase MiaA [Odoribacteraceae bacterium]|jgi:tRNA dimethylallyltransferase|nr:tRNA (adenosine(37)-N6)-dimethylallyltransferase MiaA [Odoribacteraceae bacterium]